MEWIPVWTICPIADPAAKSTPTLEDESASCNSNTSFQDLILEKIQSTHQDNL